MKHLNPEVVHGVDQHSAVFARGLAMAGVQLDRATVTWLLTDAMAFALAHIDTSTQADDEDEPVDEQEFLRFLFVAYYSLVVATALDLPELRAAVDTMVPDRPGSHG